MVLGILTKDIIVDEPCGLTNSHVDRSVRLHGATPQHLLSREGPGGLSPFPADFVHVRSTQMAWAIIGNRDCETVTPRRIRR
ncbi:hypothetical protein EN852_026740 [Mesorhizobium sp. M2E.F.Ca.ET.209.01.1.1]|uniref:hypothetical protein n=1 Tax=Mesorhizobium sp. M2E.F.Ca.ET.209.01.1.1 TaxID=2500526 RepID=UPI000FD945EF|nr:hypothetical protein [Mesorhizobium sp. M2E.F.Ca.ET.209.01.1.1]TGS10274.1 hypothetical protein EN852_026740 [Mesorhizobium sp. M2E.F.Ca.ET.209.01.1.1]